MSPIVCKTCHRWSAREHQTDQGPKLVCLGCTLETEYCNCG